jgi:hypothetical protein
MENTFMPALNEAFIVPCNITVTRSDSHFDSDSGSTVDSDRRRQRKSFYFSFYSSFISPLKGH